MASKKKSSGQKASKASKSSKPKKKPRARRGFANVSALSGIAPAGLATQAIGGVAGFIATGYAVSKIAERARYSPGSMLAKLGEGSVIPAVTRAAIALAAGWALRRFVSRPIGNAVAVGGLVNAGASFAARSMSGYISAPLLGIGDPAGIDLLHPEYDTSKGSLGVLADEDIQNVLEAARSDAGMGEIAGNVDEGNLSPAAVAGIIRAA
ncbi:MAG: hypothetical protein IT436_05190 [Phycisphaerales bacterium]|nr:hypothetical protein [Phycisphaerales bacterium]